MMEWPPFPAMTFWGSLMDCPFPIPVDDEDGNIVFHHPISHRKMSDDEVLAWGKPMKTATGHNVSMSAPLILGAGIIILVGCTVLSCLFGLGVAAMMGRSERPPVEQAQ